jgi:hypothetical protein
VDVEKMLRPLREEKVCHCLVVCCLPTLPLSQCRVLAG